MNTNARDGFIFVCGACCGVCVALLIWLVTH